MNVLDIILLAPLAYAAFKGFKKGFIYEIFSLLALGLGIYGCLEFSGYATTHLTEYLDPESKWLPLVSYTVTFIAIVILVTLLGTFITKVVTWIQLGMINKLFGSLFGLVKAVFFVSTILMIFNTINSGITMLSPELMEESLLYEPLSGFILQVLPNNHENPVYKTFQDNLNSMFQ